MKDLTNDFSFEKTDTDDVTTLKLSGSIDEDSHIEEIYKGAKKTIVINLKKINMINSVGIREWVNAIEVENDKDITLVEVATSVVAQINMISNFIGRAKIQSFYAPYYCQDCSEEHDFLLDLDKDFPDKNRPVAPLFKCPTCQADLDFDDVEAKYFYFVTRK